MEQITDALDLSSAKNGKPHLIMAHTTKGKGVSFMQNVVKWHHGVPTEEQMALALAELDSQLKELM
jgi:transketolase